MTIKRGIALTALSALLASVTTGAQNSAGSGPIHEADARQWLTYLSSDLLQGRQVFTEGYGLASSYIAEQLRAIGVEPLGSEGTYFQPVVRRGYRVTNESSVTVTARGETRTFRHGDHVTFPATSGARQTLKFSGVEFAGYGLRAVAGADAPEARLDLAGKLAIFLPGTPDSLKQSGGTLARGLVSVTGRAATLVRGPGAAGGAIGLIAAPPGGRQGGPSAGGGQGGRGGQQRPDLSTVQPVDRPAPPALTADDEFFAFLLGDAGGGIKALREKANDGDPLPTLTLADVQVTIEIDARYEVLSTERTQNVVGVIRGSDPTLRDTYVLFGAHLDHVGYAGGTQTPGRANVPVEQDSIWNGADDDGSGSTAVLAIAKAFVTGPKPRRSVLVVWHAGEEAGLIGSEYMAGNPVVPIDSIQAVFNIDMIGRNRDDNAAMADTVFLIGADRISTDFHNLIVDANTKLSRPLTLDYEYNDVSDPNSFYTRSDHYSYASRGIPSAFFFTGTHADYHANTDTVDKILFPKLVRITEFIYQAGYGLADRAEPIVRDNLGPRSGRGFTGRLPQ